MRPSWPRVGFAQARELAAQLGWELTRVYRSDLGWVYLLRPPVGPIRVLYDLNTLFNHLPRP